MAVAANTVESYDNSVLREDLQEAYNMISPEEVPFQAAIGSAPAATNKQHEWPIVELAAVDRTNAVIEGEDAPDLDVGTLADRVSNFTQVMDKMVSVSHTSEAVDAAAMNIQRLSKQVALKLKELKRDHEGILLTNWQAVPGSSGTARRMAGFPAFIKTNTNTLGAGSTAPTLSSDPDGYPDAAWVEATTPAAITEAQFNAVIQACWTAGGNPTIAMCNENNKSVISSNFTGNSTRFKDRIDKTLVNAVDVYDSDFGEVSIVPNRFQPALNADNSAAGDGGGSGDEYYIGFIDPEFAGISWLEGVRQKPIAETGHSKKRLIWCEATLQIDNEAAHGIYVGTSGAAS